VAFYDEEERIPIAFNMDEKHDFFEVPVCDCHVLVCVSPRRTVGGHQFSRFVPPFGVASSDITGPRHATLGTRFGDRRAGCGIRRGEQGWETYSDVRWGYMMGLGDSVVLDVFVMRDGVPQIAQTYTLFGKKGQIRRTP